MVNSRRNFNFLLLVTKKTYVTWWYFIGDAERAPERARRCGHGHGQHAHGAAAPPAHAGAGRRRPPAGALPPALRAVGAGPGAPARGPRARPARRALRAAGGGGRRRRAGRAARTLPADPGRARGRPVAAAGRHAGAARAAAACRAAAHLRLHRRPGEEEAHPATARSPAARPQVPAARVAIQRRDVAVHVTALQDHEGCSQSYDVVSGE